VALPHNIPSVLKPNNPKKSLISPCKKPKTMSEGYKVIDSSLPNFITLTIIDPGEIDYFTADVTTQNDYYPFGMLMDERHGNTPDYRYAFQGMESDDEVTNNIGTSYDFGNRIYSPRIGKWLSRDPLEKKYPPFSPYLYCINNPIFFIDLDGRDVDPSVRNEKDPYDWSGIYASVAWRPIGKTVWGATVTHGLSIQINSGRGKVKTTYEFSLYLSAMWSEDHIFYDKMVERYESTAGNVFSMKEKRTKEHEYEHIKFQMEIVNQSYSIHYKVYGQKSGGNYTGTPDKILQDAYDEISFEVLTNDYQVKKRRQLSDEDKLAFDDAMIKLLDNVGQLLMAEILINTPIEDIEENEVRNRTQASENEWQLFFLDGRHFPKLPYTTEEANFMNENPGSARISTIATDLKSVIKAVKSHL
jgi:RHS repeat-associated protein